MIPTAYCYHHHDVMFMCIVDMHIHIIGHLFALNCVSHKKK